MVLSLAGIPLFAQSFKVEGKVTDENGSGLGFATIHQKNTTNGTTSNALGYYTLELTENTNNLVFQYVGYRTEERTVNRDSGVIQLDVEMIPELVELDAVVVSAQSEDPAYAIIRKAIANRKKHLSETADYRCEVYIKGMQRLDQVPGTVLGIPIAVDTGIVYLSESVSQFSFEQPNKVKERVISSKVSGDNRAFSFNQASDMLINFYENQIYAEGLSERSFISPIAENAQLFYRYELLGTTRENGRVLNKIKVIPRRDHDPSFSGEIYIIDGTWRIHSLNLLLTKTHQIEFVDSLSVRQVMAPVTTPDNKEVWMVLTQQFDFLLNAFGFKGYGYFVGVYRDYQVNLGFNKGHFSNEIVKVEPKSNQKDSSYWNNIRPIPLTIDEIADYHIKDSLQIVKDSKPYQDSVDRKSNKITPVNILITGKTIQNSFHQRSWNFPPLIQMLQYNTVEGFVPYFRSSFTRRFEDFSYYRISPELRYGFSNQRFNARLNFRYYYNPMQFASIGFSGGRFIEQLNEDSPLQPIDNSLYTLFLEKNYLKIFEKLHFTLRHHLEITNGLYLTGILEWAQRNPLENTTDYTFRDRTERAFTPNFPDNQELESTSFEKHQVFLLNARIRWQPGQKYIRRPYRKFITKTTYPSLWLEFQAAIPDVLGADLQYQRLNGGVSHDFKLGMVGAGHISMEAGGFLNKDSVSFVDFKHFNGNRTIFGHFKLGNFQLLDYYYYSTIKPYFQGHYEHHFNGFIFNKIPLLRQTKIQAVSALNYLHTVESKSYWEVGLGIEHIFKIIRVDYFHSWQAGMHQRSGVRLGVGF
ncbi:MAG: membrane protein [Cyclobacteriaceae bacterium]|nr:MAG: membrane protein [Cyclobacteriaceae bacterium]